MNYIIEDPWLLKEAVSIEKLDKLDTKRLTEKFIEYYLTEESTPGNQNGKKRKTFPKANIAIVSEVGTGKSFFLKLLYRKLDNYIKNYSVEESIPNYKLIYIDIANYYRYNKEIELMILALLIDRLDWRKKTRGLISDFITLLDVISSVYPLLNQKTEIIKKVLTNTIKLSGPEKIEDYIDIDKLITKLKELQKEQIIVMIDNLERCSPEYITEFFFQVHRLMSLENYTFIAAYDKSALRDVLEHFYGPKFKTLDFFKKFNFQEYYLGRYYKSIEKLIKDEIEINLSEGYDSPLLNSDNLISIFKKIYVNYNKSSHFRISLRILLIIMKKYVAACNHFSKNKNLNDYDKIYILILFFFKFLDERSYYNLCEEVQYNDGLTGEINMSEPFINFKQTCDGKIFVLILNNINIYTKQSATELFKWEDLKSSLYKIELIQ